MNEIRISVVIPVYNAEKTIERCIESVQRQTFQDFEIIAVNDGSFDHSQELLERIGSAEQRLHIISQENKGVSAARNAALNSAAGEFVMFVDGDDHLEENYLEVYYSAITQSGADIVIGGCTQVNIDTHEINRIIPPETGDITQNAWKYLSRNVRCFGYICSKIIRRDLIEDHGIRFDETMYSQEDLNFNLDVYRYAGKIAAIDDTGYIYEYSKTNRRPDTIGYIRNQLKLMEICREKNTFSREIQSNIEKRLQSYVFSYLLNSEDINDAFTQLDSVEDLDKTLSHIKLNSEKSYISRLYANSHKGMIKAHFRLRRSLRRLIGKG